MKSPLNPDKQTNVQRVHSVQLKESGAEKIQAPFQDMRSEAIAQRKLQEKADAFSQKNTIQKIPNNTGLPDKLKSGIESLSGQSMDDVKVHYNSDKPAQLNAHAYAQGTDIHIASGQEKHLPHEAWHVVQQKEGRVKPTMQMKEKVNINDDTGLEKEADVMGAKAMTVKAPKDTEDTIQRKKITQSNGVVQRELSEEEKADKLRILKDYVQFTPPTDLADEYGTYPKHKVPYLEELLKKIRSTKNSIYSLKTKKSMAADLEDDNWEDDSFNYRTLKAAIDAIYKIDSGKLALKDDSRLIGREDARFEEHDCVWAAVTYGLNKADSLEEERALAAHYSSKEGEVEDSILYRIMEKLGWEFEGQGYFDHMFPMPTPGFANVANIKNRYNGRYIMSEDRDAGGKSGHVLAVDVVDVDDPSVEIIGFRREITLTDRQHERRTHGAKRSELPRHTVYVWKVT